MKKWLLFLFASQLLCSCSCLLSQIPPKYIYAEAGCQAPIPNYIPMVTVTGGCTGFTVTQTPSAGTFLTATNKVATVVIKATGLNQKSSQISFVVTMIDTITPKITPLPALMAYQEEQVKELYDAGDRITIAMFKEFDKAFPWSDTVTYAPGAGPMTDSMYNEMMLISVSMDSAGVRKRVTTYGDSVIINPGPVQWEDIGNKPGSFYPIPHSHLWDNIINAPDTTRWQYMVDYRDFYDWMAYGEYIPIPKRTPASSTTVPNMSLVSAGYNFTPLIFDPVVLKMKFWNGTVWKTITSN